MIYGDLFSAIWRLESQGDFTLSPSGSLGFPATDFLKTDANCLVINIFNLIGVDSPLPHYLLGLAVSNGVFADFIKVFNEQFYRLFYEAWKAVHPLANQMLYQHWVSHFLGLHEQSFLSSYVDCLVLKPGMVALKKCLRRLLGSIPFSLVEYAEHWFVVGNASQLGVFSQVNNCLLGSRFFTDQSAMACTVGPVFEEESVNLLVLQDLLSHFSLGVKIKLTVKYDDRSIRLGKNCLGSVYLISVYRVFVC